ncbi:MAG TPA: NmrA family NAD(P)-binding protein [Chitinispirillaceae bacterium]|nr:NmrA family NAD(P)-binding protein [Chitinispirillaceae bacterium]
MYVITDVSSRFGGKVALELLRSGQKVRGIGNHRENLAYLKSEGMEIATGEMDDPVFLASAFKDAHTLVLIAPAPVNMENFSNAFHQVGIAVCHAVKDSKINAIFFLSSMGVEQSTESGLILGLRDIEQQLETLSTENIIYLHPGYFMEHTLSKISFIKSKDMVADSIDSQTPLYMVSSQDIANYVVSMIMKKSYYGRMIVELYGDRLTYRQLTKMIGTSIGIPELPYTQLMDLEMRNVLIENGFSINMANAYVEMSHALGRGAVSPNLIDREVPNCPTRFIQFLEKIFVPAFNAAI